jgi:hypothetical protein
MKIFFFNFSDTGGLSVCVCISRGEEMMYTVFRLYAEAMNVLFPDRKETVILCLVVLSSSS